MKRLRAGLEHSIELLHKMGRQLKRENQERENGHVGEVLLLRKLLKEKMPDLRI